MKVIASFFNLIRWPNLIFIALTQFCFYYFVYGSMAKEFNQNQQFLFILLVLSSVFIAGAGYIINDYFDTKIDAINKPDKLIVGKIIKRRWVIIWHWIFNITGLSLSFYISIKTNIWIILIVNIFCTYLLWIYSTTLKRKLLSGNIIVAALTAWTILVVYFFVGANIFSFNGWDLNNNKLNIQIFFKFTLLYAGFAFIMTLIREVVKDLEDMDGDRQYHCNTMPIAWGVPVSKVFISVWIVVAATSLFIIQLYAWQLRNWISALYFLLLVISPLILLIVKLRKATSQKDYAALSKLIKLIILAGILSMFLIKIRF